MWSRACNKYKHWLIFSNWQYDKISLKSLIQREIHFLLPFKNINKSHITVSCVINKISMLLFFILHMETGIVLKITFFSSPSQSIIEAIPLNLCKSPLVLLVETKVSIWVPAEGVEI